MGKQNIQQKIDELIEQIRLLNVAEFKKSESTVSERNIDLMLQHLKDLYGNILALNFAEINSTTKIIKPEKKQETVIELKPVKEDLESEVSKIIEKKEQQTQKKSGSVMAEIQNRTRPKPSLNEKFKNETKELGEKIGLKPISDLKIAIGVNQRYVFINEIFGKSGAEFDSAIRQINGLKSYEEASAFLNNQLRTKYKWDEKNSVVKDFIELVKRRFL